MALPHARSTQVVHLHPLGQRVADTPSFAIIKARQLEVIRVVLAAGQDMHQLGAPGEATLYCLEGEARFRAEGSAETLRAGDFLHLQPGTPYSLHALRDASLLVTFCLVAA